jgi:hypothetical protein
MAHRVPNSGVLLQLVAAPGYAVLWLGRASHTYPAQLAHKPFAPDTTRVIPLASKARKLSCKKDSYEAKPLNLKPLEFLLVRPWGWAASP